jgi:hypothetical protein
MSSIPELGKEELIDLLNRCWMTHDGVWFYHCWQEFGIEKANHLNKAAIKSLSPIEIERIKKALGIDNMNASMSFPRKNVLHWAFEPNKCFAFKGIRRIGAIDQYECGVIYRVACWFDSLGLQYCVHHPSEDA